MLEQQVGQLVQHAEQAIQRLRQIAREKDCPHAARVGPGDADRVDFVLAVAANRHHRDAVERALKRGNGGSLPGRLALLDFDMVREPEFDWSSVFEFTI
jgi:hypothetical protein